MGWYVVTRSVGCCWCKRRMGEGDNERGGDRRKMTQGCARCLSAPLPLFTPYPHLPVTRRPPLSSASRRQSPSGQHPPRGRHTRSPH